MSVPRKKEDDSDLFEDEGFLDDDYVDEDDLYDYGRMDGDSSPSYVSHHYPADYSDDLMDEEEVSGQEAVPCIRPRNLPLPLRKTHWIKLLTVCFRTICSEGMNLRGCISICPEVFMIIPAWSAGKVRRYAPHADHATHPI